MCSRRIISKFLFRDIQWKKNERKTLWITCCNYFLFIRIIIFVCITGSYLLLWRHFIGKDKEVRRKYCNGNLVIGKIEKVCFCIENTKFPSYCIAQKNIFNEFFVDVGMVTSCLLFASVPIILRWSSTLLCWCSFSTSLTAEAFKIATFSVECLTAAFLFSPAHGLCA